MKLLKTACLSVTLGLLASNFYAQEKQEKTDGPLKLAIKAQSSNIDKGGEVTDRFLVNGDLKFTTKDDLFTLGVFAASSIEKGYTEFDYYAKVQKSGFSVAVWDIFNYSNLRSDSDKNASKKPEYNAFNYNGRENGRFLDFVLEYQFNDSFPLKLHWNTVFFGNPDRDVIDKKGAVGNRYSTYVSAYYPVIQGQKVDLTAGVGGTFAFREGKTNRYSLYGDTAGVINIELKATRNIEIFDHKLPVSFSGIWNPQAQRTYMQVAFELVSF